MASTCAAFAARTSSSFCSAVAAWEVASAKAILACLRSPSTSALTWLKIFAKRTRGKLIDLPEFAFGHDDEMLLRVPDIVQMRGWRPERATTRTMVLLAFWIQGWKCNRQIKPWLERANSQVNGKSPAELIIGGEWSILANLVDGLLTEDQNVKLKGGDGLP